MSTSASPWQQCAVCQSSLQFHSPSEFISHLRHKHCRREGGSFVCHYGYNGVCSSLPLEGVSDADYERHVRMRHLVTPPSGTPSCGHPRSVSASVAAAGSSSSSCGPAKWSLHSASQNLAALLNDPSRSRQRDFFTKTWGDSFVPTAVTESPLFPDVSETDFQSYVQLVNKRQHRQFQRELHRCGAAGGRTHLSQQVSRGESEDSGEEGSDSLPRLSLVPNVWFDCDFDLRDQHTFRLICPEGVVRCRSPPAASSSSFSQSGKWSVRGQHQQKQQKMPEFSRIDRSTHDQLTYYLDVVEMHIASQVSDKSETFFDAMSSHDALMKRLHDATDSVQSLRRNIAAVRRTQILLPASLLRSRQLRLNGCRLLQLLQLMRTLRQTQPTIQLLLAAGDYVGALELIATSHEVLQQDLAGVSAFRHLTGQLTEMRTLINKMVSTEYVRLITTDLNRPVEEGSPFDQDVMVPVLLGMVRLANVHLIDIYREECRTTVSALIKQVSIESLAAAENCDVSSSAKAAVESCQQQNSKSGGSSVVNDLQLPLVESLSSDQWLSLLRRLCQSLAILLERIKLFCDVLLCVLGGASESVSECEGGADTVAQSVATLSLSQQHALAPDRGRHGGEGELSEDQMARLSSSARHLPWRLAEMMQERCSTLLQIYMRNSGSGDVPQFLALADIVEEFTDRCRQLSGKTCRVLQVTLQAQASRFVQMFDGERRHKLALLLDSERWRQADAPAHFQTLIDRLVETGEVSLSNSHSPSDHQSLPTAATTAGVAADTSATQSRLRVLEGEYCVVGTVLMLLSMVFEYCDCVRRLRSVSPDLLTRLVELLRMFNSVSCRLVVGGGAVGQSSAALKSISLRSLALTSRSLQLVVALVPFIGQLFQKYLPEDHSSLRHLQQLCDDYAAHVGEIEAKLVTVVTDMCENQLNKWQAKPPVPSQYFRAICRAIGKLHESVSGVLEADVALRLLMAVNSPLMRSLRRHVTLRLRISRDSGPQHSVVSSELVFYCQRLRQCAVDVREADIAELVWSDSPQDTNSLAKCAVEPAHSQSECAQ